VVEGPLSKGLDAVIKTRRGETFSIDVPISIGPGVTSALLGPNGAGKSTVVAALAGLLPLEGGRITLADSVLDDPSEDRFVPPEERNIGVVFQDYLLFPHLGVIDNVAFGLRSRGMPREEASTRAEHWLDRFGLRGLEQRKPGDLSGGQAQRVALARALVTEPDLLLLDEPLSALDVTTRVELRRDLAYHLSSFTGPRLLITHDPTEAFLLADVIHVVEEGSVTQAGTAEDIRLRPRTRYVADLAGVNLVKGVASGGVVDTGTHSLHIADADVGGPVLATIRPSSISLYMSEPEGSPRNTWRTSIAIIEHLGDRARLLTGDPLPLTAEVTEASARELGLATGGDVWLSIKATEISVEPA
jgi:molybdate transport system ATP-binding protein